MMTAATFIGFGEAGRAFAWTGARAFDRKTLDPDMRGSLIEAYKTAGVTGANDAATALSGASAVLSLVTADQAFIAAREYAPLLDAGALWLDMNSVAPGTKRRAAEVIEAEGGRYVDVAVMAPVLPARRSVPLLVAGPHAGAASQALMALGFSYVSIAGPHIGDASAIKMIRSVMVKGLEALSAECALAADRAGVSDAVLASLDASWKPQSWGDRFDYNLDRMMAHGLRRAAEMEEVAVTLEELGVDPAMTRGIITRQRDLGALGIAPPAGLAAKLQAINLTNTSDAV
ncbi:NAD(P)-dependent oxidoreductase [Blastomonas aquatica]|uniref:6-phosphogluconate dehydrogenase n=1 Tax=Blastomonas aquatica TaxID=1510276 RepID=A0ABQ1IZT1_9SPHN|nr:NAD(P)-dependent oxidoreductase [Blastomonas aquatica]GGB56661.1 6-phosphogluconate dehydrogenase [Blastomonas aquatica]